ncbi:MAG: lipoyl synthase [Firmicutes bacterium HGW-Firmicutes-1]|jgi:lipoic acid synthetase|nr:MAG: lipoyl synthase [Firmicutes bacterium HGW-Firmicutes-1]
MKPEWLKIRGSSLKERDEVMQMLADLKLNTVCQEAACPNMVECFGRRTATFMILGATCTRGCTFCNVAEGIPSSIDENEVLSVAVAVKKLNLSHVVVTSVTRDDLEDGGAGHFANTIKAIKELNQETSIEVLIPDLKGKPSALETVMNAMPAIIAHNIETVESLYSRVRPQANYKRSLEVLSFVKKRGDNIYTKSGMMLGLGESFDQIIQVLRDLRSVECDLLTVGQYLAPTKQHYPIERYVHPNEFEEIKKHALKMGFLHVASGPLVRSSYHADDAMKSTNISKTISNLTDEIV